MAKYKFEEIVINSTVKKKPVEEDKYTYLGLEHLDSCNLTVSRFGSDVAPKGEKLIMKKGDVLFGKRRAYQKKVAIAPFDGIFSAHGMVLRPKEDVINKDFFPMFISSDYFLDEAIKISVGSLSPTINWGTLKNLEFNLPDMKEQEKLAKILWAAHDTKEAYKKLLSLTDELVKSQFIEMFGYIDSNPKGWDMITWEEVLTIQNGKDYKKVQDINGMFPVYGSGGIMGRATEFLCPENTVIIGRKGTINNPILVREPFWNVDTAFGLISNPAILNYMYFFWFCILYDFERHNKATVLPSLTKNDLLKIQMQLPPLELQEQFAVFVKQSDKSKFELQQTILSLENTIKSLMLQNVS